jgi:1,4-dihydroxy-2-naphthoate octaprenyltransferase
MYALPVLPQARKLRNLGILKILLVGFVWGGTTVILPYLAVEDQLPWDVHVEALQRLVLVLVLMLPFEIRDLAYDDPSLRTIPQRYGVKVTRNIGIIASLIFFVLTYFKDHYGLPELLGKAILTISLVVLLWKTRKEQGRYFASFWVEAIPMFWLALVLTLEVVI